jgi:two-component system cell cycle sensor histidine kinase/response regulator CckA
MASKKPEFKSTSISFKASLSGFLMGMFCTVLSLVLGNSMFNSSRTEFEAQYRNVYLREAKILSELAGLLKSGDDRTILEDIERVYETAGAKPADEYLCIVDKNSKLTIHTARPDTIGNDAGKNPIVSETEIPEKCLADLVESQQDYVGDYISSSGQHQLAAFAAVPDKGWVLGIHRSKQALTDHIEDGMKFSKTGFYIICGVLMPLSWLLVYMTFHLIEKRRRKAEASLNESQAFLDNISDIAYLADDKGNVAWVNPAIERATGLPPEKIMGRPFLPLFIEADHASLMDTYQRTLNGASLENILTFTSGATCHFTSLPKHNQQGDIIGTFGVARDISEQLAAEHRLKTSEDRLKKAQTMAKVGNWEYDISTGKVWGSEEAFRIYGIERTSEFLPLDEIEHHIIDAKKVNQAMTDLISQNKIYDIEFQINHKSGEGVTHIHSMADLVCDGDGRPVKVVGVIHDVTKQKRLEEGRRQSDERYRNLLDNLNAGVVVHAPDTSILIANPMACNLLGLSEDQMLGKEAIDPQWKFLREDGNDMPLVEYPVNRVLSSPGNPLINAVVGVNRSRTEDVVWLLVNGFAKSDHAGTIDQVIINFVDITDRKKTEELLRQSERDLKESQRIAHLGSWRLDVKTNEVLWTEELYKMYGFDPALPPPPYTEHMKLFTPESWERLSTSLARTSETGIPYELELETVKEDGSNGWMWVRGETVSDETGNTTGLWGAAQDITEYKRTERALKESEARFKALHNASFGGIAIHDKGLILECNQGMTEITGFSYDELIGMNGLLLISEDTRNKVIQNIEAGYEKPYEATGVRKDGERYPLQLEGKNIPYKGKDVRVVEFRDIADIKQAEKEKAELEGKLHQAQKMEAVGRLAGGVAHDFNNMLSVIIGHADMVLEDVDPSLPLYPRLEEIRKAGERSAGLTRQLLAFARKQTVSPELIDLNTTVAGILKMLQRLIGEDIDLTWLPGEHIWTVKMDPGQIDQILANLCVNARDAIKGVGKITIETGTVEFDATYCSDHPGFLPGDYVLLAVSDDGCGMDADTLNNIFEPFFTTKENGEGTGLGLAMIYGIVKQNEGFINVYSEPNRGTTFKIYLPRHHIGKRVLEKEKKAVQSEGGHETVLLVEDEPSILRMTRMMLERMGYQVVAARTPGEAVRLAQVHAGEIHLLVTDVVMPEMNGRDLAETILSIYPGIRRLFMSGYTANVIAHHGVLDEGINFIQKPFSRETLGAKVRASLDKGDY